MFGLKSYQGVHTVFGFEVSVHSTDWSSAHIPLGFHWNLWIYTLFDKAAEVQPDWRVSEQVSAAWRLAAKICD